MGKTDLAPGLIKHTGYLGKNDAPKETELPTAACIYYGVRDVEADGS